MRTTELAYWITAREEMRKHKEAGLPFPHHADPLMANHRYTNVRREDDRTTRWIADHWRTPHHRSEILTRAMCLARMVNYIPTLEEVGYPEPWDSEYIAETLYDRALAGYKVWSSAYMITTCGKKMDKVIYVVDHVCSNVPEVTACPTLVLAYKKLREVDGLGSFLAAQIIADLKNTPGNSLSEAPDWHSWSAPGPGSLRGLTALYGYPVTEATYQPHIEKAWQEVKPRLSKDLYDLSLQDFQNCLCEFSKYTRGSFKSNYTGKGN